MIIYPAVDIKNGQSVRLKKGDFNQSKVYFTDPAQAAQKWIDEGTNVLHVVDLDGAKEGKPTNTEAIKKIVALGVKVQLGGGLRSIENLREAFNLGIWRAVLGTALVKNEELAKQAVDEFGAEHIVAGVDLKGGQVAVEGWLEGSEIGYEVLLGQLYDVGVRNLIVTDIDRDGMQGGPNFRLMQEIVSLKLVRSSELGVQGKNQNTPQTPNPKPRTAFDIIASGGVHLLDDLIKLNEIGVAGAIVGTALYENRFNLREALKIACSPNE